MLVLSSRVVMSGFMSLFLVGDSSVVRKLR